MAAQLMVNNVTKTYRVDDHQIAALTGVSLNVRREEFVCIIGRNGCGKSTLLKIIAGIEQPTSGTIIAPETAYLPQQPSLLPWRTVEQNLFLPSDIKRLSRAQQKSRVAQLLEEFGLEKFATHYPYTLSGGMQQKVALLRTILTSPTCILLDEPFAALDAITRLELQRWLLELKKRTQATVVCVTHDVREAIYLADTIYVFTPAPHRGVKKMSVSRQTAPRLEKQLYELLVGTL